MSRMRPAALGVLGGVGEEVDEDLLEPRRVGLEPEVAAVDRDASSVVLPLLDERPDGLDGLVEDRRGVDDLRPEADLAAGDPGDVEQVVDEPGEVLDLPLDDVHGPGSIAPRPSAHA